MDSQKSLKYNIWTFGAYIHLWNTIWGVFSTKMKTLAKTYQHTGIYKKNDVCLSVTLIICTFFFVSEFSQIFLKISFFFFWNLKILRSENFEIWNLKILKSEICKFWKLKSENFENFQGLFLFLMIIKIFLDFRDFKIFDGFQDFLLFSRFFYFQTFLLSSSMIETHAAIHTVFYISVVVVYNTSH